MRTVSKFFKGLFLLLGLGLVAAGGTLFSFEIPQIHSKVIRATVSDSIGYVVVPAPGAESLPSKATGPRHMGTGFDITLPSGKVAIITNRHVCHPSKDGYVYVIRSNSQVEYKRKILKVSEMSDLCLVEPLPESKGLTLADSLSVGDRVISVGHPAGLPLMPAYGEAVSIMQIPVLQGIYPLKSEEAKGCKHANQIKIITESPFTGETVLICANIDIAVLTTCQIVGGSSGSPLFNVWGNVVGVMFAGGENNWGFAIPLQQVKEFLNGE